MPLVLTITPAPGHGRPGDRQIRTLAHGSLSIGRSAGNDWVLADPDQHLSRTHCMIAFDKGRCTLTDLSSNGMYINGAREPTQRNSRMTLTDGDSVRLGGYILEVAETDEPQAAASPGGFPQTAQDPFGDDPLSVDPLEHPLGGGGGFSSFQHLAPAAQPGFRQTDPFDEIEKDRNRGGISDDDLFGSKAEQFSGPTGSDHADIRNVAFNAPKTVKSAGPAPMNFDDLDDLLGDIAPTAAPHPLAPQAHPSAAPQTARPATPSAPAATSPFDDLGLDDLLGGDAPSPAPAPAPAPAAVPVPAPPPPPPPVTAVAPPPPAPPQAQAPAAAVPGDAAALVRAFLEGAGVPHLALPAGDPVAALRQFGTLFAALVEGTREVLMLRAEIKREMRTDATMIRAQNNNALKFSVTPAEAVAALLHPNRPGYMPPAQAVAEAYKDIRVHEMAVMAGMQTAMLSLLGRFDPSALEGRLQRGMLDSILPGARKARYWEAFCATYKDIAREAEDDFHKAFGKQFAEAYDKQVGKL